MTAQGTRHATIRDPAYWRDAFAQPETRPWLTLLLDLPTDEAVAALPVAASAFPAFPIATTPLAPGTAPTALASWKREGTHAFSAWSCAPVVPRSLTGGGGLGRAVGHYYHQVLPELRRPYALLWRDVRGVLVPAAAGQFGRSDAFAAAALAALDTLVAQQGFRDVAFMAEVRERVAGGSHERLRALLPQSRAALETVEYRLVRGPKQAFYEGYLPKELSPIDNGCG